MIENIIWHDNKNNLKTGFILLLWNLKQYLSLCLLIVHYFCNKTVNYPEGNNTGQKTCRVFHVLEQFLYPTSETELDYYHQKVNVWVASRVVKRLKTNFLWKLGNFKKILEMVEFDGKYSTGHPKEKPKSQLQSIR